MQAVLGTAYLHVPAGSAAGDCRLPRRPGIVRYALPLSIIGGSVSIYHYMVQKVPGMEEISPCRTGVPCGSDYLDLFGWLTIPLLALVAFVLITILLFTASKDESEE